MVVHPSVRLLLGLSLIVISSALDVYLLVVFAVALFVWLFVHKDLVALRWLRRARYLLIVPPIVSGYAIAGTGVLPWDVWAPTWQGLGIGLLQSLKLLAVLLALRSAFCGLSSTEMLRGLIGLMSPLRRFGVQPDPVARRLQLTLYYLEQMDGLSARELFSAFHQDRYRIESRCASRLISSHENRTGY